MTAPGVIDEELIKLIRQLIALCFREKFDENNNELKKQKLDILHKIKESKTKEYILSYKSGKIMIWDHPDYKGDENYQIRYVTDPNSDKYRIESGYLSNAVIINDQEIIEIRDGKISHYGEEKQFSKKEYDWRKGVKNLYHIRQESIRRYEKKLQMGNIHIEVPFYISDKNIERFNILKQQLSSDDKSESASAYNKIREIAIPYDFIAKTIPYYDENGDFISGFDDNREKRRFYEKINNEQISSKYSILYRLNRNGNFEFITSDLSSDFFILAIKNHGTEQQKIELIEFGNKLGKIETNILNYDPNHKLSCGEMCREIRSGNAVNFGICLIEKQTEFLNKIYRDYLLQENPVNAKIIIDILDDILSFDQTNILIKTYHPFLLSIGELEFKIKLSIDNIRESEDYSVANIKKIFSSDISSWSIQENKKDKKFTDNIKPKSKKHNIKVKRDYYLVRSFTDNNCKTEDGSIYCGEVFLYSKYKNFDYTNQEHRSNSFIIEISRENEFRIRLGSGEKSNQVDTEIHIEDKIIYIKDNKIIGDIEILKESFSPEYMCNGCINHYEQKNQDLILANKVQQSSRSI